MESFGIGGVAGVIAAGAGLVWLTVRRVRARLAARAAGRGPGRGAAGRIEALAAAQADLAARLEALAAASAAPEERMQAVAGQMLGLIRDKNATLETALAGLDQLRARMRALEQMGEPAEARAILERLGGRLDELATALAAGDASLEARLRALETPAADAATELAARLAKLYEAREAGLEAVIGRLGALEGERAHAAAGREGLKRLGARLEAVQAEQGAARAELAGLKAAADGGEIRALGAELGKLHTQKEALAEAVLMRLAALETSARDALALEARLAALEAGERDRPLSALAERLAELHAQKDAATEAVLARLHPVEAKLAEIEAGFAERLASLEADDGERPLADLAERLAELHAQKDAAAEAVLARLGPVEAKLAGIEAGFAGRLASLEADDGERPLADLAARLAELHAQKDAATEAVLARLGPLEAKLAELQGELSGRAPAAALDGFAERLASLEADDGERPLADLAERLAELHVQKDAAAEAVLARLGPVEAKLAELEAGFAGRLASLEADDGERPLADLAARLAELHAQKDAATEAVLTRLGPVEAKLAELQGELSGRAPAAALDGFAERLASLEADDGERPLADLAERLAELHVQKDAAAEAVLARLGPVEAKLAELEAGFAGRLASLEADDGERPLADLAARLAELHAQKDAATEAVLTRLGPVEAKLAELQGELSGRAPAAALDGFAERLASLEADDGERPLADLAARLAELHAQKDAAAAAVLTRLGPVEAKLAELEAGLAGLAPAGADARAEVEGLVARIRELQWAQGEVAAGLAALRAAREGDAPLAELTGQLVRLQAQKDAAAEAAEAALGRLGPVEAKLAEIEAGLAARAVDPDAEAARAAMTGAIAARAAAEATEPLLARLARLEAAPEPAAPGEPEEPAAVEPGDIWSLPRLVTLHRPPVTRA